MLPSRLGPYRIVRKVGRGGMGTVYMGVDDSSGQTAAVKLLAAEMAQQSDFRERFKGEIETLRKLNHPNIVQILGFGQDEEQYLLFDGVRLRQQPRGAAWPRPRVFLAGGGPVRHRRRSGLAARPRPRRDPSRHQARQSSA